MDDGDETGTRWRAIAVLAILAVASLWGLLVLLLSGDAVVDPAALDQTASFIEAQQQRGAVVIHPPWRDDVVAQLRQRLPRKDVRLAPPVQGGLPRPPIALVQVGSSPGPGGFSALQPSAQAAHGALVVDLYEGRAVVTAAVDEPSSSILLDSVQALRVQVELASRTVNCDDYDPTGPSYRCPTLPEWNHVGQRELVIAGQSRRCLWAHPITGGRVVIEAPWPSGATRLKVRYGLADSAATAPGGQPVTLELLAGERAIASFVQENRRGYSEKNVDLSGEETSERLSFVVTTPHDGARHFCLDAQAVTP